MALYLRFRTRAEIQNTVRMAIERGETLNPELIETLAMDLTNPYGDLRRGVIALALGSAFYLMAFGIGEEGAEGPLKAVAIFPILIGIAYLGLWFFIGRKKLKDESA